jgi:hypothetical protein
MENVGIRIAIAIGLRGLQSIANPDSDSDTESGCSIFGFGLMLGR